MSSPAPLPTEWAVQATGLRKAYGRRPALDGLDLHAPRVGVHALIGPNASGKTTLIRSCLGLSRINGGDLRVLGHPIPRESAPALARVGAIVEQPRFVGSFSGHKNLRLLADAAGLPRRRVDEALQTVGLRGLERNRYGTYSLGLRQRIAVAACLLKQPDLVILDEPTNGLDPQGVHEMLTLMRNLADSGRAVLVSSHHLPELAQVADTVTIIGHGRTLAEGRLDDVIGQHARGGWLVRVADAAHAHHVLSRHGWEIRPDHRGLIALGPWAPEAITQQLAGEGLWVSGLEPASSGLQDAYLALTDPVLGVPR